MLSEGFKSKKDQRIFLSFALEIISLISDIRLLVKVLLKVIKNLNRKIAD